MNHRKGKILLVGFGPGSAEHMTQRAREAIAEADTVIGYSTYINLVRDLLDGKEVVRKGMTEEIDRCIEAWERARQGKTVALVSSGDIGVYGMAGPTYETLFDAGWTPDSDIEVEVIPGATALNAAASLIGAPLTHDFCAISLSDLLTPWPRIARRLEAAGRADFVVALYNPKSGRRTRQIVEAQRILLRYRRPDTPVAIVKSAYRAKQDIQLVTLEEMAERKIGMLTTVLVGNSQTFARHGLMVTPRGYGNKYDPETGAIREGEQAGRSLRLGLENWQACAAEWLAEDPTRTPEAAAEHFDAPPGAVLAAIAARPAAGAWEAVRLAAERLPEMADHVLRRGRIRVEMGGAGGMRGKLVMEAAQLSLTHDRLAGSHPDCRLEARWNDLRHVFLLREADGRRELLGFDTADAELFRLGADDAASRAMFDDLWARYRGVSTLNENAGAFSTG